MKALLRLWQAPTGQSVPPCAPSPGGERALPRARKAPRDLHREDEVGRPGAPRVREKGVEGFLECEVLAHGFTRFHYHDCGHDHGPSALPGLRFRRDRADQQFSGPKEYPRGNSSIPAIAFGRHDDPLQGPRNFDAYLLLNIEPGEMIMLVNLSTSLNGSSWQDGASARSDADAMIRRKIGGPDLYCLIPPAAIR